MAQAGQSGPLWDCAIIGGGPAGLTAAVYLGRFYRSVVVFDHGKSRARYIRKSHNCPGFQYGISGEELLERLRAQARTYGAALYHDEVTQIARNADGFFVVTARENEIRARVILLATGIVDYAPRLPGIGEQIYNGAVRFCPICDGYESSDRRIGVIGPLDNAVRKAVFLRSYTSSITVLSTDEETACDPDQVKALEEAGIPVPDEAVADLFIYDDRVEAVMKSGRHLRFDVLYPVMGAHIRSELAAALGLKEAGTEDYIPTDKNQRTAIEGVYAIGDITNDLAQISVALGQAAHAATDIHNRLPKNFRGEPIP